MLQAPQAVVLNTLGISGTCWPNILLRFVFCVLEGTFKSEGPFLRNWSYLRKWSYLRHGSVPQNPFLSEELFLRKYFRKCSFSESSSGTIPRIVQGTVPGTFFSEPFQELFLRNCSRFCSLWDFLRERFQELLFSKNRMLTLLAGDDLISKFET